MFPIWLTVFRSPTSIRKGAMHDGEAREMVRQDLQAIVRSDQVIPLPIERNSLSGTLFMP